MDRVPHATTHAEPVAIPAHRDPQEYLRSIQEQQRVAPPVEVRQPDVEPELPRAPSHRFRTILLTTVLGATVLAAVVWALGGTASGDASDLAPAAADVPRETSPIVPAAHLAVTRDDASPSHRYLVGEGDSLFMIAARFDTTVEVLMDLNGLSDPDELVVGTELVLPPAPDR